MRILALLPIVIAAPLAAADLAVIKTVQVLSDGISIANPKALPAARIEYGLSVTNPATNLGVTIAAETVSDTIDPGVKLILADAGANGSGPVAFDDGGALGSGVASSGMAYSYGGLPSMTDGLEFYDGVSWSYVPMPDADGCDARVRAIRVRLTGQQRAATRFRLRYRVMIR